MKHAAVSSTGHGGGKLLGINSASSLRAAQWMNLPTTLLFKTHREIAHTQTCA
jgi:hypothetical protein